VKTVFPEEENGKQEGNKRNRVEPQRVLHERDRFSKLEKFHGCGLF
jgi:hypothetical protein